MVEHKPETDGVSTSEEQYRSVPGPPSKDRTTALAEAFPYLLGGAFGAPKSTLLGRVKTFPPISNRDASELLLVRN